MTNQFEKSPTSYKNPLSLTIIFFVMILIFNNESNYLQETRLNKKLYGFWKGIWGHGCDDIDEDLFINKSTPVTSDNKLYFCSIFLSQLQFSWLS